MKTYLKVFCITMLLFLLVTCASMIPLKVGPTPDITIDRTPERVARGEYLANNATGCIFCHSGLNWDYYGGGLPESDTKGAGGWHDAMSMGLMGGFDLYFPNITPAAIGDWTDGEIVQAITEGVDKDGKPLFVIMPYEVYRGMDQEDVYSIVAYIRTLEAISNPLPEKKVKRILKYIERTFPKPWEPEKRPDPSNTIAYGRYVASMAECIRCHTPMTKTGKPIEGMDLAGGMEFHLPNGDVVRSANITPDTETGIGNWSEEDFIETFREYSDPQVMTPGVKNTIMPWSFLAQMTEEDLSAIFNYLQTVKPIENEVETWPAEE